MEEIYRAYHLREKWFLRFRSIKLAKMRMQKKTAPIRMVEKAFNAGGEEDIWDDPVYLSYAAYKKSKKRTYSAFKKRNNL